MKRLFLCILIVVGVAVNWTRSTISLAQTPSPTWTRTLAWSPDGTKIATGRQDGTIQVWNASTGQLLRTLQQSGSGLVLSVIWHSDSRKLASGGFDQPIVVWDTTTGQALLTFHEPLPRYTDLAWSPDGTRLAAVNDGGIFNIWDATAGQLLTTIPSPGFSYAVAWSPDGSKIATGAYSTIVVWSPNGQKIAALQDNGGDVESLAWSPDGTKLASANLEGIIHTWDASSNQILKTFTGHTTLASSVAWSPDGTKLASASADNTVRVWDAATGQSINTIQSSDRVFAVAWSPYGGRLAFAGAVANSALARTQTLAGGAVHMVVPAPTAEKLQAITKRCTKADVEQRLVSRIGAARLPDFIAEVKKLPKEQMPPACAADLIAVAEALQKKQ